MRSKIESVSVVGLGYIGLPTAAILASKKVKVIGVDIDESIVESVNRGNVHIAEPNLESLVRDAVKRGYLRATTNPEPTDAYIIAVPTPFLEGHRPDLSFIDAAANAIAPCLKNGDLVILESTSPVGTTERLEQRLSEIRRDLTFPSNAGSEAQVQVAYCPERVLPGNMLNELTSNDRVVGGMSPHCAEQAVSLYRAFVKGECLTTDVRTAEMCKLTENSFRDVNIAFANEVSIICDELDINVWELIRLANHHPRVEILQPGPGVGGHCIAVDPWFIVSNSPDNSRLIRTAREVNDSKPQHVLRTIKETANNVSEPVVACLGLSFKADVDDVRESPSLEIVKLLAKDKAIRILLVEPNIGTIPDALINLRHVEMMSLDNALELANIVVMLVNHREFYSINASQLKGKHIVDAKGVWQ